MITGNTISQINRALENSFSAIKKDMNELRLLAQANAEQFSSLKTSIESIKGEAASKDKINVLKIKIGELHEEIKKMWELDKKIEALKQPQFDRKSLRAELNDLNAKLIATELRLVEYNKRAATESQLRTVVSGVNAEFNKILTEVRNIEIKKDELGKKAFAAFEVKMDKKFAAEHEAIAALRKEVKNYVTKHELKDVLGDLNNDLDSLKKDIVVMQKDNKAFVREGEVQGLLKAINKEFDGVAGELELLRKQNKEFVTVNQVKGLINDISDEFDEIKSQLSGLTAVKQDADKFKKETARTISEMQKKVSVNKSDSYGASVVMREPAKAVPKQPMRKTYAFGNFMIFVSFLMLLSSIVSFYINAPAYMDSFAIAAVATFVLGMVSRMIAVIKGQ